MKSKVRSYAGSSFIEYVISSMFLVVGLGAAIVLGLRPAYQAVQAGSWDAVPCTVEKAEVYQTRDDMVMLDLSYTFLYRDQEYKGRRYNFEQGSSNRRTAKQAIADRYPPGTETTCFVNPRNPRDSVLSRDPTDYLFASLISIPFLVLGVGGLYFTRVRKRFQTRGVKQAPEPPAVSPPSEGDVQELTPKVSGLRRAAIHLVFALAYNLFFFGLSAFGSGNALCLFPFLLIGLAMLFIGVPYSFLQSFNPVPHIVLSGHLAPGSTVDVMWEFRGQTSRLRSITVTLTGTEKARYRRGTNTATAEHVFVKQEVLAIEGEEASSGLTTLTIPAKTMPSFASNNNEVVWEILLHADIARWPDVRETFPVTVHPTRRNDPLQPST